MYHNICSVLDGTNQIRSTKSVINNQTSVAAATKKDVSSAKDKKSALEQEKKKTEEAIKSLQGLKSNTESYVKELDTKMNDLQSQVTKLENNISSKQKSIDETAVKLEEAQKTEKKQYASMKMRIKYMYEKGDSSYLNLLLEARSLSELLNRAEYVSKISTCIFCQLWYDKTNKCSKKNRNTF